MNEGGEYQRFLKPTPGAQFPSEYDIDSSSLADLIARNVAPLQVITIDLSSQPTGGKLTLPIAGRGFVPYFWQTNTTNRARQPSGLIDVAVNCDGSDVSQVFPSKHNRGFIGSFSQLTLTWVNQANTSVDFIIHKSDLTPWMTDDAASSSSGSVTQVTATSPLASTGGTTPVISIVDTTAAAKFLAGPSGAGGAVTERSIVASDLPAIPASGLGTITDGITLDQAGAGSTLEIKPGGVGSTQLGSGSVTAVKLGAVADGVTLDQSGSGSTLEAKNNGISNAKLAQAGANTLKGNNTGGTANVSDLTVAQVKALLNTAPTRQIFTSGSGTYTLPANVLYISVRIVGGGGGGAGGGSSSGAGGNGGITTFGTSLLSASPGVGGSGLIGGAGGSASLGSGPIGIAFTGGTGSAGGGAGSAVVVPGGGTGSSTAFGGAGGGGNLTQAGFAAVSNTGSGGGGGATNDIGTNSGAGGGAGGYVDAIINSPSATYAYAVGAAGSAGTAGTSGTAGGAGASGLVEVTEYYQ